MRFLNFSVTFFNHVVAQYVCIKNDINLHNLIFQVLVLHKSSLSSAHYLWEFNQLQLKFRLDRLYVRMKNKKRDNLKVVENAEIVEEEEEKSNLKGDYTNMALLLGLYFLQGIISGITSAIPILLQNRGVSYKQQALFRCLCITYCAGYHFF